MKYERESAQLSHRLNVFQAVQKFACGSEWSNCSRSRWALVLSGAYGRRLDAFQEKGFSAGCLKMQLQLSLG